MEKRDEDFRVPKMLIELAEWLDHHAEERLKQAVSRYEESKTMRESTLAELQAAKSLAEKMTGRKLPRVTLDDAAEQAEIQDRIAKKLESEARKISKWADVVRKVSERGTEETKVDK